VLLRRPLLPQAVPAADLDLVKEAGQAYCAHLARHPEVAVKRFEALVAKHPRERYLHYGYGLALAQQGSQRATELFRREVELFPDDVLARVELGFALLARGQEQEAVPPAEEAARLAPGLATHLVPPALVATGRLGAGPRARDGGDPGPQVPEIQLARRGGARPAARPTPSRPTPGSARSCGAARRRKDRRRRGSPEAWAIIAESPTSCPFAPRARLPAATLPEGFEALRSVPPPRPPGVPSGIGLPGRARDCADWDEGWWYLGALLTSRSGAPRRTSLSSAWAGQAGPWLGDARGLRLRARDFAWPSTGSAGPGLAATRSPAGPRAPAFAP
jgi:tetratricopeptide (TPR) repeat protein